MQERATWRFATRQKVDQKHHYIYTYLTLIGLTKFIAEVGVGRLNTPVPEQRSQTDAQGRTALALVGALVGAKLL